MTLSKNGKRLGRPRKDDHSFINFPLIQQPEFIQVQVGERFALLTAGHHYLVHNGTIYEKML